PMPTIELTDVPPSLMSSLAMCEWASISPGETNLPVPSITSAPEGTFTLTPIALILPFCSTIVPFWIVPRVAVSSVALRMATAPLCAWPPRRAVELGSATIAASATSAAARRACRYVTESSMRAGDRTLSYDTRMKIIGIALIVLGVLGLAYGGFSYTKEKKVIDLGPVQATTRTEETVPVPPLLSGAAVAGGIVILVVSARKR